MPLAQAALDAIFDARRDLVHGLRGGGVDAQGGYSGHPRQIDAQGPVGVFEYGRLEDHQTASGRYVGRVVRFPDDDFDRGVARRPLEQASELEQKALGKRPSALGFDRAQERHERVLVALEEKLELVDGATVGALVTPDLGDSQRVAGDGRDPIAQLSARIVRKEALRRDRWLEPQDRHRDDARDKAPAAEGTTLRRRRGEVGSFLGECASSHRRSGPAFDSPAWSNAFACLQSTAFGLLRP